MANPVAGSIGMVPDNEDVVRAFPGGRIDNGVLVAGAFLIPPDHENEMSFDRLFHEVPSLEEGLTAFRDRSRLKLRKSGRLVRWNVGEMLAAVREESVFSDVRVEAVPLQPEGNHPANPAHAVLVPVPSDELQSDYLLDLLRPVIRGIYPAV